MISKSILAKDLRGKKALLERDIENGAGQGIAKGSIVMIVDSIQGSGVEIKTYRCKCCGQFATVRRLSRNDLTLVEE